MRHVMIIALFSMVCSEISFNESSYCIETSQLSCVANQLTGFCGVRFFTQRCFRINYIYFWTKIFSLVIFCILTANFSGLMYQDVLLLIGLEIIFVLIVIQLCHLFSLQVFNNFLMILTSIYRFNKFKSFSHLHRGVSWSFFFFVFPCRWIIIYGTQE